MNQTETIQLGVPAEAELSEPDMPPALAIGLISAVLGSALAVAGVYVLFGVGWALLAGALPPLVLAAAMFRGLKHA